MLQELSVSKNKLFTWVFIPYRITYHIAGLVSNYCDHTDYQDLCWNYPTFFWYPVCPSDVRNHCRIFYQELY
jgi:hypothetical protein